MNKNKVTSYFKLPSLRLTELKSRLEPADKKYPAKLSDMNKAYLFGIEVEVENIPDAPNKLNYWNITTDNSLRNHGYEYCSFPIRANQVEGAIQELDEALPKTRTFSERTSCHVHMNVRDLTISEIYNLIVIYYALENVIFKWVGHDRENNIFCIPLNEGRFYRSLPYFETHINDTIHNWNKYTALNLIPIREKGTVEFRHMYGTLDSGTLLTWINILCCLKDTAKRYEPKKLQEIIKNLNTNSEYQLFLSNVFGQYHTIFDTYPLQSLMEKPISQLKLGFPTKDVAVAPRDDHDEPNVGDFQGIDLQPIQTEPRIGFTRNTITTQPVTENQNGLRERRDELLARQLAEIRAREEMRAATNRVQNNHGWQEAIPATGFFTNQPITRN